MKFGKRDLFWAAAAVGPAALSAAPARASPGQALAEPVSFAVWNAVNTATQGYADCLDRFDMAGLVKLFSHDCVYDYAPGLIMRGRAEVEAGARKSLAKVVRSSHFVGPPVVEADDTPGAYRSTVYFMAVHEQTDGGRHTVCGRYLDLFVPDPAGRLLIAHRHTLGQVAEGTSAPRYWLPRQSSQ
jgi:ketosteroid isomerase-like protein